MLLLLDKAFVMFFTSRGFCFSWLIKSRNCRIRVKCEMWQPCPAQFLYFNGPAEGKTIRKLSKVVKNDFKKMVKVTCTIAWHVALNKCFKQGSVYFWSKKLHYYYSCSLIITKSVTLHLLIIKFYLAISVCKL